MSYSQTPMPVVAYPVYRRRADGAVVAGVASGLAVHLGVDVTKVRGVLALLSLLGGLGIVLYVGIWVGTKSVNLKQPVTGRLNTAAVRVLAIAAALGGIATSLLTIGVSWQVSVPFIVMAVGAVLAWLAYDHHESKRATITVVFGALIVLSGVLLAAFQWENQQQFGTAVASVLMTLIGVSVLAIPFGLRMWEKFNTAREEKLLADERAEVAAKLHDSVLQTLALIQKRADDAEEVARLARSQERQLRRWLFEPVPEADATVYAAINRACAEVEDTFGLRISPVFVGEDHPITESLQSAILAGREAMVNAAKHAGVDTVDVYAETFDGLRLYVRDRGVGFDPENISPDRHGVTESIIGRVERAGGKVTITSSTRDAAASDEPVGGCRVGTEVEISMPFREE